MTEKLYTHESIQAEYKIPAHAIYNIRLALGIRPVSYGAAADAGKRGKGANAVMSLYSQDQVDQMVKYRLGAKERRSEDAKRRFTALTLATGRKLQPNHVRDTTELRALLAEVLPLLRDVKAAMVEFYAAAPSPIMESAHQPVIVPETWQTPLTTKEENGVIVHQSGARLVSGRHLGGVRD